MNGGGNKPGGNISIGYYWGVVSTLDVIKTDLDGVIILVPRVFADNRGSFYESFSRRTLRSVGIEMDVVQVNHSISLKKGTVRGLHFQQIPMAQTKLVRVLRGSIVDFVVDLRKSSPNYLKSIRIELTADNPRLVYIPKGFAHGMAAMEDQTEVEYIVDEFYSPECDRSIRYDDPQIGIDWPIDTPILSDKDQRAPFLRDSDCNFT